MFQQVLLMNGTNIDAADNFNETALMMAASFGHLRIVEVLLSISDLSGIE